MAGLQERKGSVVLNMKVESSQRGQKINGMGLTNAGTYLSAETFVCEEQVS